MRLATLLLVLAGSPVFADIVASTTTPFSLGGTVTSVDLTAVSLGTATIIGTGYTVTFVPGTEADTGVVVGALAGKYAVPIDNGSPWSAQGGKYFSTGDQGNSIVFTFATAQTGLAFLWGSIDTFNNVLISFNSGENYTGTQAAVAASTLPNGNQGNGGSAWVAISPTISGQTFTTVTFTSVQYSMEFAGVQASTENFGVPDGGMTLMLLGSALVGLETLRRRIRV